ncbi:NAD(P)H-dependent oxidoreductase [Massilia atriviolacea]|uniref:NAD(P)H-dependent oxidoreductase n=1 Tax=Massilia atriviolacea TaxID=2495579 RepID=A0A430HK68_9BURK|nr:NAD(P)H-dependent oxidoreductase [Massilia atriviolacea]RSZ57900.1 NAD(P)H-dependent oxidoreductase [Massilia atriviolacea]
MASRKIAVIIGSLRKESFNRKVAKTLMLLAPPTLEMEIVEIGQLPLYNQDEDAAPPPVYTEFRDKLKEFDGVLFCTPEYNRSVPAALKNAIDVGSRPYGQSAWGSKPCAIVSVTPGALGAFGANHHLRQSLVFLNMPAMQQPEGYLSNIASQYDGDNLTNDSTRAFLQKFVDAFAVWVERHAD